MEVSMAQFEKRLPKLGSEYIAQMQLPQKLAFTKMEGIGNDYVYVWLENLDTPITDPGPLAVFMSDRNYGVGGDGLVLIGRSEKADFRMRMFNNDGSEGNMCGNASRCVGKFLYDHGYTDKKTITLETKSGIRTLSLTLENNKVSAVTVDMGKPIINPCDIPMNAEGESFINQEIHVNGATIKGTGVSMGNPHFVITMHNIASLDLPAIGPSFEHHEMFPERVNTEFIEVVNRQKVRMRVWERGSGETLACGTGACAVLVACALNNYTDRKATIELRGGELTIEWAEDGIVYMTGPAREVFSGEIELI